MLRKTDGEGEKRLRGWTNVPRLGKVVAYNSYEGGVRTVSVAVRCIAHAILNVFDTSSRY